VRLTEKQRKVLITAYRLGYHDLPGRVSSKELAERLKIKSSALIVRRRKAERRLPAKLVGA
jgi:predicted DNA binding protein